MSANPLDDLVDIAVILNERDDPRAVWLLRAIVDHINSETPLDVSLGLAGGRGRSPRFEWRKRQRDHFLRQALQALGGNHAALAVEIRHYRARIPKRQQQESRPAEHWPLHLKSIHMAARVGMGLPETRGGVHAALSNEAPPVSLTVNVGKCLHGLTGDENEI